MYKSAFFRPTEISIEVEGEQRAAARKKIAGKKHVFELMKPLGRAKCTTRCCAFCDRRMQSRRVSRVAHEKRARKCTKWFTLYWHIRWLRYLVNAPASLVHTSYFVNVSKSMKMRSEGARTPASFTRHWNSAVALRWILWRYMNVWRSERFTSGSMRAKRHLNSI